MAVIFKLDFRPVFRRLARAELDAFANAIAALPRPKVGGRAGGSLFDEIRKMKPRLKRWGYVLPYWEFGQKLWWLIHGANRARSTQPARGPLPDRDAEFAQTLGDELEAKAASLFARADAALAA